MPESSPESALARGLSLNSQLRWDEAARHWQAALERYPEIPDFVFLLGMALVHCNEFARAAAHFDGLRARFPNGPLGGLGTGLLQEAAQQWDRAAQTYEDLLLRFPDHPAALAGLARTLVKTGRRNAARARLRQALARNPDSPKIREILGIFGAVSKADIVNQLIRQFGLQSFLEYNKPIGGLVFHDVECREKSIAYIPEHQFEKEQDARIVERARLAVAANRNENYLGLSALLAHYVGRRFDLIFYDPLHVRPEVDHAFQMLPRLLNPDGFLVVHDCNPEDISLTTKHRDREGWLGETYKAFAAFHRHNPGRSITVAEDFGVGVICNRDLVLDYPLDIDLDYETFAQDRRAHVGLVSHAEFSSLLAGGDRIALMQAALQA